MRPLVTTALVRPLYKSFSPYLHSNSNATSSILFSSSLQFFSSSKHPSIPPPPPPANRSMSTCLDTCATTDGTRQRHRDPNRNPIDDYAQHPRYAQFYKHKPPSFVRNLHTQVAPNLDLWAQMVDEANVDVEQEPVLSGYYYTSILSQKSLETALANHLAVKLSNSSLPIATLFDIFGDVLHKNPDAVRAVKDDLRAVKERDPACISYVHCFLSFKGFLAIQAHRIAHELWLKERKALALMIQNRVSEVFGVDIHPGARIGGGVLLDHATGVVIGETAVVGDNVSILHSVTLGGTGKMSGDRHPKIGDGVLIGAGTCVLGNIRVGEGAKIGACSVVLKDVPARTTAVGNPARLIGGKENPTKLDKIPSFTMDHTSHIAEWSDYVI
ncbi:Serine acetyltransferase 1, chloroplastic [Linum perenne]